MFRLKLNLLSVSSQNGLPQISGFFRGSKGRVVLVYLREGIFVFNSLTLSVAIDKGWIGEEKEEEQ